MKKLFAADLDGTLLNAQGQSDEVINEGVKKVIESQNYIAISSGRSRYQVGIADLPKGMYTVCLNGALVLDPDKNTIYKNKIDNEIIEDYMNTFPDYPLEFISDKHSYALCSKEEYINNSGLLKVFEGVFDKDRIEIQILHDIRFNQTRETILNQDICKVTLYNGTRLPNKRLEAFLEKHKDKLVNGATNDSMYEMTHIDANKGKSVEWLAHHLGIDLDHVQVYGDAGNDTEMLKRFKYAFVPETGMDVAKQYAYEIIGPFHEYSVIKHILDSIE